MNTSLSDSEYDKLESLLSRFDKENAMNLEELDGFFTSLICAPEMTLPSTYLKEIWGGGEMSKDDEFNDKQELQDFMNLIMRHWNTVIKKLGDDEVFLPLLLEDSDGNAGGNDWARGFVRGMELHNEDWATLLEDEDNGGALVPIFALANEHNPDPELRPYKEPVGEELREKLIAGISAGAMLIYKYFYDDRREMASGVAGHTFWREEPKIGRNEPCPCGSGRKYKRCCGDVTLN